MDEPYSRRSLLERALDALEEKTGARGQVLKWGPSDPGMDGWSFQDARITISTPTGQRYEYSVAIKQWVDRMATLANVRNRAVHLAESGPYSEVLLVTAHLTPKLLDNCRRELNLQAIDVAGNAYLNRPGLYVCSRGERSDPSLALSRSGKAGGIAWLRVVYAILSDPKLTGATYRQIANSSGVALGTVSSVLRDLEHRHLLVSTPDGRRIVEPKRLVQEWITQYPTRLKPKLNSKILRAEDPDWWRTAVLPDGAYWGGDVAAARLTEYLKPVDVTIYVEPSRRDIIVAQLVRQHRLRADKAGNLEILDLPLPAERPHAARDTVHPLIIYADLLSTVDPRHREVAEMVREKHLHDLLGT